MNLPIKATNGLGAVLLQVAAVLLFEELTFGGLVRLLLGPLENVAVAVAPKRILLIIDQFEDALAARDEQEAERQIEHLRSIRYMNLPSCRELVSYRADLKARLVSGVVLHATVAMAKRGGTDFRSQEQFTPSSLFDRLPGLVHCGNRSSVMLLMQIRPATLATIGALTYLYICTSNAENSRGKTGNELADSTTKCNGNPSGRWMGWGSILEALPPSKDCQECATAISSKKNDTKSPPSSERVFPRGPIREDKHNRDFWGLILLAPRRPR